MFQLIRGNKKFRLLLVYQIFSGLGGGIFSIFMLLSVHLMYGNPLYTGIAGFLIVFPHIFSLMVGPVVDRRSKVTIMRLTTLLEFLVLTLLVVLSAFEILSVVVMFVIIFIYALAALFEGPAATAYLPQIVEENHIMQANSCIMSATMVGGIAIAVFLFGVLGEVDNTGFGIIYGVSAVFVAIAFLVSLFMRDVELKQAKTTAHNYLDDLKAGFNFLKRSILMFVLIMWVARAFVAEIAYVNMPMFLETHIGAQGYVIVQVLVLVGGVIASSLVGTFGGKFKIGYLLFALSLLAGGARIVFALVLPNSYFGGLAVVLIYSILVVSGGIIISSMLQKIPPKDMVGRVDTLTGTFMAIAIAVGALAGGYIGDIIPEVEHVFVIHGIMIIVIGLGAILTPGIRKLPRMNDISKDGDSD